MLAIISKRLCIIFAGIALATANYGRLCGAQTTGPNMAALSTSWQSISSTEFVKAVDAMSGQKASWNTEVQQNFDNAVNEEAARRLRMNGTLTTEEPGALSRMAQWASLALKPSERVLISNTLIAGIRNSSGSSFAQVQAAYGAQWSLNGPLDERRALVEDWLAGRDLSQMPHAELNWCALALGQCRGADNHGMQVRWTGTIRPPQSGPYTFSASTTRNDVDTSFMRSHSVMKLWIDGKPALDTTNAAAVANPVSLSADEASAIRVEFTYEHNDHRGPAAHPPIAMLYWQGPGVTRQLVSASALAPPTGTAGGPGLLGEYAVQGGHDAQPNENAPYTVQRIDPQIDFVWTTSSTFLLKDRRLLGQVMEAWINGATKSEYLDQWRTRGSHVPIDWITLTEFMTSAQRKKWTQAITASVGVLKAMGPDDLLALFHVVRMGAEEDSVDLLGHWAQLHANDSPEVTAQYFYDNRRVYFWLADLLTFEHAEGYRLLKERYLEMPDGRCTLGVAHILAFANAFRGRLEEWIAELEARLADKTLTGDIRVSWLLARARAEEIRGAGRSYERFQILPERYHVGGQWIDEAGLVAESEPVKLLVFEERFAREVWAEHNVEAAAILDAATAHLTSTASQQRLAAIREKAGKIYEIRQQQRLAHEQTGLAPHVEELKRRKTAAAERGDQAAVDHYDALIQNGQQPQE